MKWNAISILSTLVLAMSTFGHSIAIASEPARPNIVVIFIDDLGYADIGPFGATKQRTPNLDRMAAEGMKLTSFYAAPVCSVSRAQLLTGCYGARVSVPGVFFPGNAVGLHPAEETTAEYLKPLGYATACIGKWHLGDQADFLPTNQGFDHYFGIPYSNDMQRKAVGGSERVSPLMRDDKVVELLTDEDQSRIVERYTQEAVRFLQDNKNQPFFLYLPHSAVHTPIHPGIAFRGKSANGRFGDWVEEMDWSVGRIFETLRELKLDENTLVLFTSDNGPWLIKGSDGGSALPLRGGKGSTWEGGVRVPTIARWPGKIQPGSVCDAVAGTIDILPTAVSIAGGKLSNGRIIDGRDISPLLLSKSKESQREAHYYFAGYKLQAVRQGPWKLAIETQPETMGKSSNDDAKTNPRLYNLDTEIDEKTNVASKYPEVVLKLQRLANKMSSEIGGEQPTSRRPAGSVDNPTTLYPMEPDKPKADIATSSAAELSKLKLGDAINSESIVQIGERPFTLRCTIATTKRDGILIAHGGASNGYALHLRDGKVVFSVRNQSGVSNVEAIMSGEASQRLRASLTKEGMLELQVADQKTVSAKGKGLISNHPKEDFCVGHDNGQPVTEYSVRTKFQDNITDIQLATP